MALVDLQRQLVALCFDAQPSAAEVATLGDARAWLVYRDMVRERIAHQLRVALPRTCALLPAPLFDAAFVWHLQHEPPRTRFFRELVGAFVASALPLWAADAQHAACDLARYELALWELSDVATPTAPEYRAFSFDAVPVLCPALRLLEVAYPVHLPDGASAAPQLYYLCLQRVSDEQRPRTFRLTKSTHELLLRMAQSETTLTETLKRLAAQTGLVIDQVYLDALCETLAQFIEDGLLLGSR
ncbi:MAG: hypothetical protein RL701_8069 [Pseudomonadota bacterium]|jgi:hypothetical protein